MNDKEKKAIRNLENLSEFGLSATLNQADLDKMKTVLNLIEKQKAEIEDAKEYADDVWRHNQELKEKLEGKECVIENQKVEIERLKNIISNTSVQFINDTIKTDKKNKEDIELLNEGWKIELEKKDKEISKLKNNNKDLLRKLRNRVKEVKKLEKYSTYKKEFSTLNKQLKKKDKIIDLILEEMVNNHCSIRDIVEEEICDDRCIGNNN